MIDRHLVGRRLNRPIDQMLTLTARRSSSVVRSPYSVDFHTRPSATGFNGHIVFAVSVSLYPWCLELRAACLAGCLSILLIFIIMSYNYGALKQVTPSYLILV